MRGGGGLGVQPPDAEKGFNVQCSENSLKLLKCRNACTD